MKSAVKIGVDVLAVFALVIGIACSDSRRSMIEKDAVGTAGTIEKSTRNAVDKTGEVLTDGWITAYVNTRFVGEDLLEDSNINVDTASRLVTLTGTVASAAGRARAVEVAKATDGVERVVNRLTVQRPKT